MIEEYEVYRLLSWNERRERGRNALEHILGAQEFGAFDFEGIPQDFYSEGESSDDDEEEEGGEDTGSSLDEETSDMSDDSSSGSDGAGQQRPVWRNGILQGLLGSTSESEGAWIVHGEQEYVFDR